MQILMAYLHIQDAGRHGNSVISVMWADALWTLECVTQAGAHDEHHVSVPSRNTIVNLKKFYICMVI